MNLSPSSAGAGAEAGACGADPLHAARVITEAITNAMHVNNFFIAKPPLHTLVAKI
jgi:hypothetical protein